MSSIASTLINNIGIPDAFRDMENFVSWYSKAGFPMLPPPGTELFETDDAISYCVFRHGRYQAEIYIVQEPELLVKHEHPGLEVVVFQATVKDGIFYKCNRPDSALPTITTTWGHPSDVLYTNQSHGGVDTGSVIETPLLLVLSKWPEQEKLHTVAAVWKGKTVGPKHEKLIQRFFPTAYLKDGYADITRR